jgi:membrane-associated protease RseP (regulator of RpoE activity)
VTFWMASFPEVRFQSIPFPILLDYLSSILRPAPEGMILILHPVGFAAWVGCLVTFINLIPAWQLDGGHISRALLGKSYHKVMSVAGIAIMMLSGYFIMAVMIAFFMMRTHQGDDGPLDDVSPLSLSRKLLTLVYLAMIALTLVALFPF